MAIFFTPCSASFSAIPRPIPRDAPVIRAVCCVSVIGMTPSRSSVRIDRIDLDLVYYTLHMSMGKRVRERQPEMRVATTDFPTAASHAFYTRLNQLLAGHHFDDFVEGQCQSFLFRNHGTAGPAARHVLPAVVDWLFRRDRFGARHRVARCGLLRLARLSGRRSGRCATGPLDHFYPAAIRGFVKLSNRSSFPVPFRLRPTTY